MPKLVPGIKPLNLAELKRMAIKELEVLAGTFDVENASSMLRQDLIFSLLNAQTEKGRCDFQFWCIGNITRWFWFFTFPGFQLRAWT